MPSQPAHLPRSIGVPGDVFFADLHLTRTADGPIAMAWAPLKAVCKQSGISIVYLKSSPALIAAVLASWYRIARMGGQPVDAVGEAILALDDARNAGEKAGVAALRFEMPPEEAPSAAMSNGFPSALDTLEHTIVAARWGLFLKSSPADWREWLCRTCGPPCHALATLAPEVLQRPEARVLMAGDATGWSTDSGRWLSLVSRLLPTAGTMRFDICTTQKPLRSALRPILFFPPQKLVAAPWRQQLAAALPDALVLNGPHDFTGVLEVATDPNFVRAASETAVLWGCLSEAEADIVAALLRALGYGVQGWTSMEQTEGLALPILEASVYLRVRAQPGVPRVLDDATLGAIRHTHLAYFAAVDVYAASSVDEQQASAIYGTVVTCPVEGVTIDPAILFGIGAGIDGNSGRLFEMTPSGLPGWTDKRIAADVMQLCPVGDGVEPSRYEMMSWIANAMLQGLERNVAGDTDAVTQRTALRQRPALSRSAGITPVLALQARLGASDASADEAFATGRKLLDAWLERKGFRLLHESTSFTEEVADGEIAIESDSEGLWALRYDDRRTMDEGAFWRIELVLRRTPVATLGLRLVQVRRRESAPLTVHGTPGIVREIAERIGLHAAGIALTSSAWTPVDAEERERLIRLIEDSERVLPVVVVAIPDEEAARAAVADLALRLTGVAFVVRSDDALSEAMQATLGRSRSLVGHGARLYPAGFARGSDPFAAPLWALDENRLSPTILDAIVEEAGVMSLRAVDEGRVPTFQSLRRTIVEARLASAQEQILQVASTAESERAHGERIQAELRTALAAYRLHLQETEQALLQALEANEVLRNERDLALTEVDRLRYQAEAWRRGLPADEVDSGISVAEEAPFPDTWDGMEEWIAERGDGRVVMLPQALKAARESVFADISFAYRVLDFLARHYVPMRQRSNNDASIRQAFEEARDALGVDVGPVGEAMKDHRYRKAYQRLYQGKTITLDQHVKRGVAFDPVALFRLYFWYDEDKRCVVVGHLPTHLPLRGGH